MAVGNDIAQEVDEIVRPQWTQRKGNVIPSLEDVGLGNDAVNLEGAILYADLARSTSLIRNNTNYVAAEIYKSFLTSAARLIRASGGEITAYDGDRIMGVYIGPNKRTAAAITALKINYAVRKIIEPKFTNFYNRAFQIRHAVGVAVGQMFVARTGVPRWNDLVWLSEATNLAAKLSSRREYPYNSFITDEVFSNAHASAKFGGANSSLMWEQSYWSEFNLMTYRSHWTWRP